MIDFLNGGFLKGQKTYLTSFLGITTSVVSYLTGTMGLPELIQTVFPLLGIAFLRRGVAVTQQPVKRRSS